MPVIDESFKMYKGYNWLSKLHRHFFKSKRNKFLPEYLIEDCQIVEKTEKERKIIIQIVCGGLGDYMVYSALPELMWKQKQTKVFISKKSIFRNQEIWDMIWDENPYVEFTDESGWFINTPLPFHSNCSTQNKYLIRLFGLQGDDSPRLYYEPVMIDHLQGKTIVDASFGPSGRANGYYESEFHEKYLDFLSKQALPFFLLDYTNINNPGPLQKKIKKRFSCETIPIDSIQTLCNVLASAQKRFLMYSGGASLVAALNLPSCIVCNKMACNNFQYSTNTYIKLMTNA